MTVTTPPPVWRGDRQRVDDCLDEIIRLRAENAWLRSQVDLLAATAQYGIADALITLLEEWNE